MLLDIRDYILREGLVNTQQLSRQFAVDETCLQPMLDIWVRKGVIAPCSDSTACQQSCRMRCRAKSVQYYQSCENVRVK